MLRTAPLLIFLILPFAAPPEPYAQSRERVLVTAAYSKDSEEVSKAANNPDWERGKAVFVANCVACHNNDPSREGKGPAIKGSSRDLLEARLLSGSYPPGYQPKRRSKEMPQFPDLKDEIPYLAAYLR